MGDHEGWAQPGDLLPSGLLPNGEVYVNRRVDNERWSLAEERTAELISRIQPNKPSEMLRNAVADYVQRLVMRCISCQVCTFGSVPLKTYLPDGDIDLTAFGNNEALRDTWANEVHIMLENEEKNENAEFRVKEVKPIQAEVKLIKCLVENIVVDISFNQVGGLCTLCFLEEVDHLINQNHLFKRSIILIKAWCYYESRILGAHHGLISTYALETLVLYIFHVFNNSFSGPLEVLYRFLEFFSNFDWENYCVSLWGPVPIRSLPDMTAESPRKDNGELLLKKLFLESCVAVYAVGGQENQGPFVSKYFNVIDPLRTSNNLGRSVNKGNFFRIRSAFGFGAKRLARLLDCPKEDIITEVNQFFMNTWERHGTGHRPDAPTASLLRLHRLNFGHHNMSENRRNQLSSNRNNENSTFHESDGYHTFHETSYQHGNEGTARTSSMPSVSHKQGQKNYGNGTGSMVSDPVAWNVNSSQRVNNEKVQEIPKPGYLVKDGHDKYQFVRTRSSPELLNNSTEISSRGRRHRALDTGKTHIDSVRSDNSSRKKNSSSEFPYSNNTRSSVNDPSSFRHTPSHQRFDTSNNSNSASNYYHDEAGLNTLGEELSSLNETMERHQEQQDLVNMMASSGFHGFNAQVQMPMNIGTSRLPFPISPSVLASMAYAQRNMPGMIPGSIPLVDPHWGTNIQFPQGMVPSSLSHYFPSMRLTSNPEEMIDSHSVNQELTVGQEHSDQDIWNEDGVASTRDFSDVNGSTHTRQFDDKQYSASTGHNFVSSSRNSSGSSSTRNQHNSDKESRRLVRDGFVREDLDDTIHHKKNRGSEGHSTERTANLRSLTTSHTSSSRSRASSESSWDESSVKVSKSTRDKRGRKPAPSTPSTVFGENKSGSQYERVSIDQGSPRADDGIRDWIPLSTMGSEMAGPNAAGSSHSRSQQLPNYDSAQMNVSESLLPIAPMVLGSGSRQGPLDNSRVLPFTFFPTGPPVPFLTMLPVYNFATNTGNSDGSSSHFDKEEEETDSSHMYQSEQNINSAECLDQLENLSINSMKNEALSEHLEEQKYDILDSDFSSHWQNLQYGRFCQNPRHHGPLFYHSPVMVPPMYLQGNFQWDGPGRPNSSNGNLISPVTGYGHRLVPVTPLQPSSSRPAGVYQRFGDEMPRYRGGTGTYLPNTKVTFRDRQSSGSRSQRGNYNYDHNDHVADRDGNWNNSKPRYSGRHYNRTQSEKGSSRSDRLATNDNRANRSWEPYRHESFPAHHSQNGSIGPSASVQNGVHGVYSSQAVNSNSNGIAPSGTGAPPVLMLYSYDPNGGFSSNAEQVEFGSLHRPHLSGVSEIPQHGEGYLGRGAHGQQRFRGNSTLSSPDQPSSPQFKR